MLAARQILSENFATSPWLRRRPGESCVVYQLMVNAADPVERVLNRLAEAGAEAVDLNLACNAKSIRSCAAGSALFENFDSLRSVVQNVRRHWPHILTAKIRLGHQRPEWEARFAERMRLLEETGVDAVILHPRFFEEKFKRRARHELFSWAASLTRLPLIANGNLSGPETFGGTADHFQFVSAVMLGRMAVARPWVFAGWDRPVSPDLAGVWAMMYDYTVEDFAPTLALRRLKMFTKYFAANFKFGHQFNVELARAASLDEMRRRAEQFFSCAPPTVVLPTVAGL
jgi:tRNA-dihydrouridine synthase B